MIKSPTANTLAFGDVRKKDAPTSLPVQITVTWTKSALGGFIGYPLLTAPACVAGTQTHGWVNRGTTSQPGSASVSFNKTVYLSAKPL